MQSGAVVKGFDVIEDSGARLGQCGEAVVVNQLVFEAAPKRFDEGVVVTVALASHRSEQSVLGQDMAISGAGELGAAIGVDDKAFEGTTLSKCHA